MQTPDIAINSPRSQNFIWQAFGALAWGTFFILMPLEFLLIGIIIWIPLLIYRERIRENQFGFFPGFLIRAGVVAAVIIAAALVPTKPEDRRVGPLSKTKVSLADLAAADIVLLIDVRYESVQLLLPSTTPTLREITQAILQQTKVNARCTYCGNGSNILLGGFGGCIIAGEN